MADEPIRLGSNGLNTPPPIGTTNGRHIVGSSATAGTAWEGHDGEYAEEVDGGYRFTGKAHMASMTFAYGGAVYSHNGTDLVLASLPDPATYTGGILISDGTAWVSHPQPTAEAGPHLLSATNDAGTTTYAWVAAADYENP